MASLFSLYAYITICNAKEDKICPTLQIPDKQYIFSHANNVHTCTNNIQLKFGQKYLSIKLMGCCLAARIPDIDIVIAYLCPYWYSTELMATSVKSKDREKCSILSILSFHPAKTWFIGEKQSIFWSCWIEKHPGKWIYLQKLGESMRHHTFYLCL